MAIGSVPTPASASACTVGGVVANNSSGMCCGTTQNSYKTLSSLSFMLPSGAFIDTAKPDAEREFAAAKDRRWPRASMEIKREIEADPAAHGEAAPRSSASRTRRAITWRRFSTARRRSRFFAA